jgi:hypothetical protein
MVTHHQIGQQELRLVLAQALEVNSDGRADDQLGAQQMPLAVAKERWASAVTETPRAGPRSMAGRSRCE